MFNLEALNKLWAYLSRSGYSQCAVKTSFGTIATPSSTRPEITPPELQVPGIREKWYYPSEIAHDLDGINLPKSAKQEVLACAWEYTRSVIPQYTNWNRYVAFMRTIIIGIIAEYKGEMIDVAAGDHLLNYNLSNVLGALLAGTPSQYVDSSLIKFVTSAGDSNLQINMAYRVDMEREFRCFLLITADKSSTRRDGLLFRRYVAALSKSPRQWFRMRDTDGLIRFTIASALACNDLDNIWYTDKQFEMLDELGTTLYDSVAFFKHRSEAETNSTFAYVPSNLRITAFHQSRELLWALDVAWAGKPEHQPVINMLRLFGGPIHMMMRRYRFVEDGLMIGRPETHIIIKQTRQNVKLWNRVDLKHASTQDVQRYRDVTAREGELMFAGLRGYLDASAEDTCPLCTYETDGSHGFGGVKLCDGCGGMWARYVEGFEERFASVFPEVLGVKCG